MVIFRGLSHIVLSLFIFGLLPLPSTASEPLSAKDILNRFDDIYRGTSAHGQMSMKVVTEHWTRELKLEFWAQGTNKSLIRILLPLKEKGTATLMVDQDIWNYLPKVNRVIKVPSSMMGGSWMGSHFTNDDLVKESRLVDDYTFEISFRGPRDGKAVVEIACTPKETAAVVWGKVVLMFQDETYIPLNVVYYDEDLKVARTMTFSDVRTVGKRTIPMKMKIVPTDKPNESTEVIYDTIEYDVVLTAQIFSRQNLER